MNCDSWRRCVHAVIEGATTAEALLVATGERGHGPEMWIARLLYACAGEVDFRLQVQFFGIPELLIARQILLAFTRSIIPRAAGRRLVTRCSVCTLTR